MERVESLRTRRDELKKRQKPGAARSFRRSDHVSDGADLAPTRGAALERIENTAFYHAVVSLRQSFADRAGCRLFRC
jgi:hypothetical protein